ncbi:ankyrin repeat domain-containing protein [Wolbachia endosymbiont of Ceratosolen solmsi]|nr:ankyrin repeat domain-containing protein [Wolbachia endosymbiont of Ceratosolen solmsi]AGK87091.1 ankyrin repeat protein [Wolbachia endosymbiont of Ceratosolen solmsi]QTP62975.1 ankyrin repeat domain-containing protein [Wolbachia endosymbiont of Ceratosolen solmsi]
MNGNKEIVELLLSKKANVHLKCFYNSKEGYTALENAVADENEEITELFLLYGITLK